MGQDQADPLDVFLGERLFPMDRASAMTSAPAEPGVITFYDKDKEPLAVLWADNLEAVIRQHVERLPAVLQVARAARFFDILPTVDRGQVAKVFDRLVDRRGHFPLLMRTAPPGAHNARPVDKGAAAPVPELVPPCAPSSDARLVAKLRAMAASLPPEPSFQDWLAYALYSNDLLEETLALCAQIVRTGRREPTHLFYMANALYKKGDVPRAIKFWETAYMLDPSCPLAKKSAARLRAARMGEDPGLTKF